MGTLLAANSVASWFPIWAIAAPGTNSMRMLVPKRLLSAASNCCAPWLPASVDWLQLSRKVPSLAACFANSLNAASGSAAAGPAVRPENASINAIADADKNAPPFSIMVLSLWMT